MLWERGKAYSQDLRERVFAAWDAGLRVGEIADQLLVSVPYVSKTLARERRTGERTARPQRSHLTPKLAVHYDMIREHVVANPDVTLAELQVWLCDVHNVSASVGLICTTLTVKKSPCGRLSRSGRMLPRREPNGGNSSRTLTPAS